MQRVCLNLPLGMFSEILAAPSQRSYMLVAISGAWAESLCAGYLLFSRAAFCSPLRATTLHNAFVCGLLHFHSGSQMVLLVAEQAVSMFCFCFVLALEQPQSSSGFLANTSFCLETQVTDHDTRCSTVQHEML